MLYIPFCPTYSRTPLEHLSCIIKFFSLLKDLFHHNQTCRISHLNNSFHSLLSISLHSFIATVFENIFYNHCLHLYHLIPSWFTSRQDLPPPLDQNVFSRLSMTFMELIQWLILSSLFPWQLLAHLTHLICLLASCGLGDHLQFLFMNPTLNFGVSQGLVLWFLLSVYSLPKWCHSVLQL